jgi:hypothetical protein
MLHPDKVPEVLKDKIYENLKRDTQWYQLIVKVLAKHPVNGKNGLKDRTQLMEFRYDTD